MNRIFLLFSLVFICFSVGCQSAPKRHYPLQAEVISVDAPKGLILVKHGEIPGLMPAMTMQYAVADPKQIEALQPGDKIGADLVVSETNGRLEKITLISKGDGKPAPGTSQHIPAKGEVVPNFALLNQDGKPVHLHDYSGRALLITFIYTRCPLPDFCPRMNQNFREIQGLLREKPESLPQVAFLSISFDPEHDTPAVLKHYAAIYKNTAKDQKALDWQFAAPSTKNLPEVASFFGLVMQSEQAQIIHSLSTTLIGPDGKVQKWYEGNDWKPADAAQAIQALMPKL
jgi:protein SCO1/2